jgi:hypothetical protein
LAWDSSSDTYSVTSLVGPTIYGHSDDLSGGNPLSSSSQADVTTISE